MFEWDSKKNKSNTEKHGISFEEAEHVFQGNLFTVIDQRIDYGEIRKISLGELNKNIILVVVYTQRGEKKRLISARKANLRERKRYYDYLSKKTEGN